MKKPLNVLFCIIFALFFLPTAIFADDGSVIAVQEAFNPDTGLNGFLGKALSEKNKGFNDFLSEYHSTNGGEMVKFFGFNAKGLLNGLTRSVGVLVMGVILGASILKKMKSQEGVDFVDLTLKFLIGLIIFAGPAYVYAVGRCIQTGG